MARTQFERVEVDRPDTAVFRVEGKLGFHENKKIERLVEECEKRGFKKVVFDFMDLSSLGGGVARILRDFVADSEKNGRRVYFAITNDVVRDFLNNGEVDISILPSLEEALAFEDPPPSAPVEEEAAVETDDNESKGEQSGDVIMMSYEGEESGETGRSDDGASGGRKADTEVSGGGEAPRIENSADGGKKTDCKDGAVKGDAEGSVKTGLSDDKIISEIFDGARKGDPPDWIDSPASPYESGGRASGSGGADNPVDINRRLKKRILELKTLFSISSDFNAIRSKKKLLDIFLLTSIAQGGVESALFLEYRDGVFVPISSKGIDKKIISDLRIDSSKLAETAKSNGTCRIEYLSGEREIESFRNLGFEHFCPFMINNEIAGICVLGKRISGRNMREEDFEFLDILSSVAQSSYRNTIMLEREHERTLGIVKTLISMIEENTLLKGTSEFVSRYVGIVAKKMNYPEEKFKDLIYGTVLRDMGMIKISDLIVKSPRELSKDEWAVIKRHPDDGAEMLKRMRFSDSVVKIVRSHHERFNGEGYPRGMRGKEIPLGARIISVVESYSAMIHDRPTRAALSNREALETLKENYGLRYDMEVTRCFARVMEREYAKSADPSVTVPEE